MRESVNLWMIQHRVQDAKNNRETMIKNVEHVKSQIFWIFMQKYLLKWNIYCNFAADNKIANEQQKVTIAQKPRRNRQSWDFINKLLTLKTEIW